ncbi:MAG: isopentenyl-diphosphate Delta-isomerase [Bacteroidales bacterium]|nr:isopentenyl-diphosphate Delta-isomerase [Bacteroidales bacterium]MDD3890864.1 isopentenyl-diphosphate Delta-isomerase [Bacteroidales bacterium]
MEKSLITLVDRNDEIVGFDEKHVVHRNGTLHRAFSIFVVNDNGELMIHRRALDKYHSPGLWTNTCCSHLPKEMEMEQAVHQRLVEEMGFDTDLLFVTSFRYTIEFDNGLIENEIDHIYVGLYNDNPAPNPIEVADFAWVSLEDLERDVTENPDQYTYWLKHIVHNHFQEVKQAIKKLLL